ncbi:MAG: VWA domain-containing protein [Chloroflexota bacterium]
MQSKIVFRRYPLIFLLVALFIMVLGLIQPLQAQEQTPVYIPLIIKGNGVGSASNSTYNITVSVYNTPTGAARTPYEENIKYFADAIYEMSNGAHKLGEVKIYSKGQFANRADVVWIQFCWPNAHVSGYGRGRGLRIQHCDVFRTKTNDFSFIGGTDNYKEGGYTLGHEWGHYFYGLLDEYQGAATGGDLGTPLASDVGVPNSIMNGQWQAVTGDFNWLNFSTSLNNNGLNTNAQGRVYNASAWDTLTRPPAQDPAAAANNNSRGVRLYYPELANFAPAANTAPSLQLPASQSTARDQLNIIWMNTTGTGAIQVSAVTDANVVRYFVIETSSDSMNTNDKLINALDAVGEIIDGASIGDIIGIITFDGSVEVVQPLTEIDSESTRTAILANLDGITIGGSGAATGNAARQALTDITTNTPDTVNRGVYLISGGSVTTGENLALGVIPDYERAGIDLYAFGYGVDETTEDKLLEAETTGGGYAFIDDSDPDFAFDDLTDALNEADQNLLPVVGVNISAGDGTFTAFGGSPFTPVEETDVFSIPFHVDSTLGEIEAEVYFQGAAAVMQPGGPAAGEAITVLNAFSMTQSIIDANPIVPDCEELSGGSDTDTICTITVTEAVSGTWYLGGFAAGGTVDFEYWIGGLAEEDNFTLDADIEAEQGEDVNLNEEVTLYATVANDQYNVISMTVQAIIIDPNDSESVLTFTDDGTGADTFANDGVYTVSYTPVLIGEHEVFASFNNSGNLAHYTEEGTHFAADRNDGITKAADEPILVGENFERIAEFEFYVDEN